jgi:hypothetical protein
MTLGIIGLGSYSRTPYTFQTALMLEEPEAGVVKFLLLPPSHLMDPSFSWRMNLNSK